MWGQYCFMQCEANTLLCNVRPTLCFVIGGQYCVMQCEANTVLCNVKPIPCYAMWDQRCVLQCEADTVLCNVRLTLCYALRPTLYYAMWNQHCVMQIWGQQSASNLATFPRFFAPVHTRSFCFSSMLFFILPKSSSVIYFRRWTTPLQVDLWEKLVPCYLKP
jgi:hypothetical protein